MDLLEVIIHLLAWLMLHNLQIQLDWTSVPSDVLLGDREQLIELSLIAEEEVR